jgi:3-dehydroquinate dehydratase
MVQRQEEQINCFAITAALKKAVKKPMLYLCSGSHCKMHRILMPAVDCSMMLVVENSREGENQPTLKRAKEVLTLAGYQDLP